MVHGGANHLAFFDAADGSVDGRIDLVGLQQMPEFILRLRLVEGREPWAQAGLSGCCNGRALGWFISAAALWWFEIWSSKPMKKSFKISWEKSKRISTKELV